MPSSVTTLSSAVSWSAPILVSLSDGQSCSELLGDDLACAGLGRTFTIGARAGVPIGQNSMLYAKAEYVYTNFGSHSYLIGGQTGHLEHRAFNLAHIQLL